MFELRRKTWDFFSGCWAALLERADELEWHILSDKVFLMCCEEAYNWAFTT